jgi:hypothetical protein
VWLVGSPFGWRAEASSDVRFISQRAAGRADGSDWANAAPLRDLPILVAQLSNGGTVLVRAGERPYRVEEPIVLGDRPADAAVTIRGFDPLGGGARPVLTGTRVEPYSSATADTGRPIFALDTGCG